MISVLEKTGSNLGVRGQDRKGYALVLYIVEDAEQLSERGQNVNRAEDGDNACPAAELYYQPWFWRGFWGRPASV